MARKSVKVAVTQKRVADWPAKYNTSLSVCLQRRALCGRARKKGLSGFDIPLLVSNALMVGKNGLWILKNLTSLDYTTILERESGQS